MLCTDKGLEMTRVGLCGKTNEEVALPLRVAGGGSNRRETAQGPSKPGAPTTSAPAAEPSAEGGGGRSGERCRAAECGEEGRAL